MELPVNRNIIVLLCFLPMCSSEPSTRNCKYLRLVNTTYHHHYPSHYTQVEGVTCEGRNVYHNGNYYLWYHSIEKKWSIGLQSGDDVQCNHTRGDISTPIVGQFPQESFAWFERHDEHSHFKATNAKVICDGDVITPAGPTNLISKCKGLRLVNTTYHHHYPSHYTLVEGVMCEDRNVYRSGNYYLWYHSIDKSWYIGQLSGAVWCKYTRGSIASKVQFPQESYSWYEQPNGHTEFQPTDAKVICDAVTTDVITPAGPNDLTASKHVSVPLLAAVGSGGVFLVAVVVIVGVLLFRRCNKRRWLTGPDSVNNPGPVTTELRSQLRSSQDNTGGDVEYEMVDSDTYYSTIRDCDVTDYPTANDSNGDYLTTTTNIDVTNGDYLTTTTNIDVTNGDYLTTTTNIDVTNGDYLTTTTNIDVTNDDYLTTTTNIDVTNGDYLTTATHIDVENSDYPAIYLNIPKYT